VWRAADGPEEGDAATDGATILNTKATRKIGPTIARPTKSQSPSNGRQRFSTAARHRHLNV